MPGSERIDLQQRRAQRGLVVVEYAISGSLIVIAVVAAFTIFGDMLKQAIQFIVDLMP